MFTTDDARFGAYWRYPGNMVVNMAMKYIQALCVGRIQ